MTPTETVQIPLTVTVSKEAYDKLVAIVPGDEDSAHKIQSVVNGLIEDLSDCGMMLSGSDVERIRTAVPEAGPDQIIEAVEESAGMEDGVTVVKWAVDGTMLEPLQQIADQQGMTVQEIVQNMMDTAVGNGWFYDTLVANKALWFEPEWYEFLRKLTGLEDISGEELYKFLQRAVEQNEQEKPEESLDDLFSTSESDNDKKLELVK
jgi:hypothetical protein